MNIMLSNMTGQRRLLVLGLLLGLVSRGFCARLPTRGDISKGKGHNDDGQLTPDAAADAILALPGFVNSLPSRHFGKSLPRDRLRFCAIFCVSYMSLYPGNAAAHTVFRPRGGGSPAVGALASDS